MLIETGSENLQDVLRQFKYRQRTETFTYDREEIHMRICCRQSGFPRNELRATDGQHAGTRVAKPISLRTRDALSAGIDSDQVTMLMPDVNPAGSIVHIAGI